MRIAYVINSLEGGGAAFPVPSIVAALARHGAEVSVLALARRDGRAEAAIRAGGTEVTVRAGGTADHWSAYRWLKAELAKRRPDAVWTSLTRATLLGQAAARPLGVPVVSWQHAAFLKPANLRLMRLARRRSALWVADSAAVADFCRGAIGIAPDRIVEWPIFRADPEAPHAAPWSPGEPVRLGSLGRLHPVKGYDVLVEALARVSSTTPWTLAIGGEGDARARLEAAIGAAGLKERVTLAGFIDDPLDFLAGLHLYLQPSRSEGCAVAAHQAMQAGLPLVASAVGEMAHSVVPGVTGALVAPGDPVALAAAIETALVAPGRLHAMGAAGRTRLLERFSADLFEARAGEIVRRLGELCRARRSVGRRASGRSA
ncbi:glycosyltransferase family 4 protein [Sphingomonas sp. ASV193]|uniref:glycosyltransferase family 4 protein n=1 Tax=Sphingomonas sp. ASV193 TaxID=3144405 RepID=UPI0032E92299